MEEQVAEIISNFKVRLNKSLSEAESYLKEGDGDVVTRKIRLALENQTKQVSPSLLEWLYDCTTKSKDSKKLLNFILQFVPDLVLLYLYSNAHNLPQLKPSVEAILFSIIKEASGPIHVMQVPSLSRTSIYHQSTSTVSPLSLTEAALNRHNQTEVPLPKQLFTGGEVNMVNMLLFVTTAMVCCIENITIYSHSSQRAFCLIAVKLVLHGMHSQCIENMTGSCVKDCLSMKQLRDLGKEKRFPVNDNFVSALLSGVRLCLCQSSHHEAKQALQALKLRAEYEVLPISIQISGTLERLSKEFNPLNLPLDPESHKSYSPRDKTHWPSRTMTILRSYTGQVLQHNLYPTVTSVSSTSELYVSSTHSNKLSHSASDETITRDMTNDESTEEVFCPSQVTIEMGNIDLIDINNQSGTSIKMTSV